MAPRSSTFAAAALLLVFGCSSPEPPAGAGAHRPGPETSPHVAAAGPRPMSSEVVFAPEIPPALRPDASLGDIELPPIPVPEGRVPVPDEAGGEFVEEEGGFEEEAGPGEVPEFVLEADPAVCEEEVSFEEEVFVDEEPVVIEEIRYGDPDDGGTAVLVVQGWNSWACGPFPVVHGARGYDPCATPRDGACWEPNDYDPCWNPCTDPKWGSWNMVEEEKGHRRHVGGEMTGGRRGGPAPKAPEPRRDPPAPAPAARTPEIARLEPVAQVPASRPDPSPRLSAPPRAERVRVQDDDVPAARVPGGGWSATRETPAREPAPRTTTPRHVSRVPEPAAEPEARPAPRTTGRSAKEPEPSTPAETPAARPERASGRGTPVARVEPKVVPVAEPKAEPRREPRAERRREPRAEPAPEIQAPTPPPPPPPAPAPRSSGGKRGK